MAWILFFSCYFLKQKILNKIEFVWRMMGLLHSLIIVVVTWLYTFVKTQRTVHSGLNFTVCKLYLYKPDFLKNWILTTQLGWKYSQMSLEALSIVTKTKKNVTRSYIIISRIWLIKKWLQSTYIDLEKSVYNIVKWGKGGTKLQIMCWQKQ